VIHDPGSPQDTLIYYKRLRIASLAIHQLIAVVVKEREEISTLNKAGRLKGIMKRFPLKFGTLHLAKNKAILAYGDAKRNERKSYDNKKATQVSVPRSWNARSCSKRVTAKQNRQASVEPRQMKCLKQSPKPTA
jgi:hypothetical protein